MISSAIARLSSSPPARQKSAKLIEQISSHPAIEIGKLINQQRLPITIEATGNQEAEEITRWIMSLDGIEFVDVVFVHMEDSDVAERPSRKSRSSPACSKL